MAAHACSSTAPRTSCFSTPHWLFIWPRSASTPQPAFPTAHPWPGSCTHCLAPGRWAFRLSRSVVTCGTAPAPSAFGGHSEGRLPGTRSPGVCSGGSPTSARPVLGNDNFSPASRGVRAGVSALPTRGVVSVSLSSRVRLPLTCRGSPERGTRPSPSWGLGRPDSLWRVPCSVLLPLPDLRGLRAGA